MRTDARKTTFVSFSGVDGARALADELCDTATTALEPFGAARPTRWWSWRSSSPHGGCKWPAGRISESTSCANSCARSAISTRASIASCSARPRGASEPTTLASAASLRIGVLAGALLGPAAAIGLRARSPGLVTSTTDAVVLAGYLALLFGLAAGVFAFLSILTAGQAVRGLTLTPAFAQRARRAAAIAGLLVDDRVPRRT